MKCPLALLGVDHAMGLLSHQFLNKLTERLNMGQCIMPEAHGVDHTMACTLNKLTE